MKMPWTKSSITKKNKKLKKSPKKAAHTAKVANAILKKTGDEGKALRIANWQAKGKKKSKKTT